MAETPRKRPARAGGRKSVARKPTSDPAVIDALNASTQAVRVMTTAATRLTETLERTEQTNKDTRRWRRIASFVGAAAVALLLALILQTRWTGQERDRNAQEQAERDAQRDAETTLLGCQNRNASQRFTRGIDQGQNDVLRSAIGNLPIVAALQAQLDSAPADRDCDHDGSLTTADYPPEAVGP